MLRVAIIGFGFMGRLHREAYLRIGSARVVAAADPDPAKRAAAEGEGLAWHPSLEPLLGAEEIDVADVCLPTHLHSAAARTALDAGKHVFCEKPLCVDLREARDLRDLARGRGLLLLVGHVLRFFPVRLYRQNTARRMHRI